MTEEEKEAVKGLLKEVLKEHHTDFYVPAEEHYQHHKQMEICQAAKPEWEANHRYVSGVRRDGGEDNHKFVSEVRKAGIKARATAVVTVTRTLWLALLGALWYATKVYFKVKGA